MSSSSEEYTNLQCFLPFYHLNNISFQLTLYELKHGSLNFDTSRFESLLFNPIDQTEAPNSYSNYIDPVDINFSYHTTISIIIW